MNNSKGTETKPSFKPGDTVRCISRLAPPAQTKFTIGNTYLVTDYNESTAGDPDWATVRDDQGVRYVANHELIAPHFELVKEAPVAKFKVGDKVRVISTDGGPSQRPYVGLTGNIYDLNELFPDVKFSDGNVVSFHISRLELVTEAEELEQLVAKANEGLKALRALQKKGGEDVEYLTINFKQYGGRTLIEYLNGWPTEVRLKPKPTFRSFETSNGWKVRVEGERLHIGCKNFDAKAFSEVLFKLNGDADPEIHTIDGYFCQTRNGIRFSPRKDNVSPVYVLLWDDAEKLRDELVNSGIA